MDPSRTTEALRDRPGIEDAAVLPVARPRDAAEELVAYIVPAASERWHLLRETAGTALAHGTEERGGPLAEYRDLWGALERTSVLVIARALAQVGGFGRAGEAVTPDDTVRRCGLLPRLTPLVRQWYRTMVRAGIVRQAAEREVYRATGRLDTDTLTALIDDSYGKVRASGDQRLLVEYHRRCADHQVQLLRGECSPLELLFPDGHTEIADYLYATNPLSSTLCRAAALAVRDMAERVPGDAPVRVLEVGAGTGALSAAVLAALPERRVTYHFTDVSSFFLNRARRRFADRPDVEYDLFDIDEDPGSQGFTPHTLDLVLAANALHTARHLDHTLTRLGSLLAPEGLLLTIERTVNTAVQMVTFGFIEGFGHYRDHRRHTNLPLLPTADWTAALTSAGFSRAASLPAENSGTGLFPERLILAEVPARAALTSPAALRQALAETLPGAPLPHHCLTVDRIPRNPDGTVDTSSLPTPPPGA